MRQSLRQLPAVAGPYQDIPAAANGEQPGPDFRRDIVVLAVPANRAAESSLRLSTSASSDTTLLNDGRYWPAADLPAGADGEAWVTLHADAPITIHAVTVALPGRRGFGAPSAPAAEFESNTDGRDYTTVVTLPGAAALVRAESFTPVTARHFRVRFASLPGLISLR